MWPQERLLIRVREIEAEAAIAALSEICATVTGHITNDWWRYKGLMPTRACRVGLNVLRASEEYAESEKLIFGCLGPIVLK